MCLYVSVLVVSGGGGWGSNGSLFHHNWLPEAFGVNWPDDGVNPGGCGYCSERCCRDSAWSHVMIELFYWRPFSSLLVK